MAYIIDPACPFDDGSGGNGFSEIDAVRGYGYRAFARKTSGGNEGYFIY